MTGHPALSREALAAIHPDLTLKQLAALSGLTKGYVVQIANGRRKAGAGAEAQLALGLAKAREEAAAGRIGRKSKRGKVRESSEQTTETKRGRPRQVDHEAIVRAYQIGMNQTELSVVFQVGRRRLRQILDKAGLSFEGMRPGKKGELQERLLEARAKWAAIAAANAREETTQEE